jgi:beta-lactamase regulating signal transducer with metallopeptidase domain
MTASWMIYAIVVGGLLSAGAHLAERSFRLAGKPVRFLWAGVMLLSILLPVVSPRLPWRLSIDLPVAPSAAAPAPLPDPRAEELAAADVARNGSGWRAAAPASIGTMAGALPVLWGVASGTLALLLLYGVGVLHGRRREWSPERLDGVDVLVSKDVGPAVIGWRRIDIVIPEWVRELEPEARALVLRHELEHVTRKDPRHVLRGYLTLIAMPWNPALWWQLRRLRRAIELDCDARVVASGVHWARYGRVLLDAVGRCRRVGLPAFAAFAERTGDLEARIRALGTERPRAWRRRAMGAGVAAGVLLAAACFTPDAMEPSLQTAPTQATPTKVADLIRLRDGRLGSSRDIMVVYRGPDGRTFAAEILKAPAAGERPGTADSPMRFLSPSAVESIEVVKGKAVGVDGIDGAIFITVKTAAIPEILERMRGSRQETQQQMQHVIQGLVISKERPLTARPGLVYLWLETDAEGELRRAGRVASEAALLTRHGTAPVASGVWALDYDKLEVIRWARYDSP